MKVVINSCYGGFKLSPLGIKRYAKLKGLPCYFFTIGKGPDFKYIPADEDKIIKDNPLLYSAFTVQNPNDYAVTREDINNLSNEEIMKKNEEHSKVSLDSRTISRDDPILIQVVEELKELANSKYSKLKSVEIPDDVQYTIEEYDGKEWVAEVHRTWE